MAVVATPLRFEVWLVNLAPTVGSEINKTRPCVVISPDEMTTHLRTVTLVALTSTARSHLSRVDYQFQRKAGQVALDHIRSVDKVRLVKKLGTLPAATAQSVCERLRELFQY